MKFLHHRPASKTQIVRVCAIETVSGITDVGLECRARDARVAFFGGHDVRQRFGNPPFDSALVRLCGLGIRLLMCAR